MDIKEFAQECDEVARDLRRVPREVRQALSTEVKDKVAVPLAAKVGAAGQGPYGNALRAATKARKLADPTIVIGGSRKVVSGGANPRQLVYGTEWGGGKRTTAVPARAGRRGYKRRSTNQFVPANPYIFKTINNNADWIFDQYADIVMDVFERVAGDG